jgi:hypothetical protein
MDYLTCAELAERAVKQAQRVGTNNWAFGFLFGYLRPSGANLLQCVNLSSHFKLY